MRKISMIFFMIFCLAVVPSLAQEMSPETVNEIMSTIRKHDKALGDHDLAGVMETYLPNEPNIVLMGTGPDEVWVGKEEIESAYMHFFEDFDAGSLITECTWHSIGAHGKVAWIWTMCYFTDSLKGQKREWEVNISTVLVKPKDTWYFLKFHFSNLTRSE